MSAPCGLSVGARVEIHSLQRAPELNGVDGEIVSAHDSGTGRWGVKTGTDGRELAIRPDNLRRIDADLAKGGMCVLEIRGLADDREREVERLKTELELENDQVAKAEIARIKQRQVGVGQGEPAGTRTAAKPTADVATSATRGSNDAVVRRVSIDGVTGSGGVVGGELTRQHLESVAPLLDGMKETRAVRNSHSTTPSLGTRVCEAAQQAHRMARGIDYSKWDKLEDPDDAEDDGASRWQPIFLAPPPHTHTPPGSTQTAPVQEATAQEPSASFVGNHKSLYEGPWWSGCPPALPDWYGPPDRAVPADRCPEKP